MPKITYQRAVKKNSMGEDLWEIEKLVDEYLVKWKGWPSSDNTWEPIESFHSWRDVLAKFNKQQLQEAAQPSIKKSSTLKKPHFSDSSQRKSYSTSSSESDEYHPKVPRIIIPSITSSRRNEIARASPPPESPDSTSDDDGSDSDSEENLAEPKKPRRLAKKLNDSSNGNNNLNNHDSNLEEPPEPGASPFNTVNPSEIFMPPGQHSGPGSYLDTKSRLSKGSMALRPPLDFFDKSAKPTASPQKAQSLWPPNLNFKKPVTPATLTNVQATHPGLRSENPDMFLGAFSPLNIFSSSDSHPDNEDIRLPLLPLSLVLPSQEILSLEEVNFNSSVMTFESSDSAPLFESMESPQSMLPDLDYVSDAELFASDEESPQASPSPSPPPPEEIDLPLQDCDDADHDTTELKIPLEKLSWLKKNINMKKHFIKPATDIGCLEESQLCACLDKLSDSLQVSKHSELLTSDSIFVHVQELQALAQRTGVMRKDFSSVFLRYGTDSFGKFWELDEIYPFGGIVTFTPQAITSNPGLVANKVTEIAKHPLWKVYLLPSAFGMAVKIYYGDNGVSKSTSDDFAFAELLDLIEEGQIVMMSNLRAFESEEEWALQQLELSLLYRVEIVEYCTNAVASRNNVTLTEINEEIKEEITVNMQQLEVFSPFVEKFRRFVILMGDDDQLDVSSEGLESLPCSQFDSMSLKSQ
ncbi:hypothetical protein BDP27DRAFT_1416923 [Rhodocollybia butyracea]|uniref:Chromo domain-containing protein n=1 Tax=Rhodocollybia butyracea TaxID=206335 RepID=A0A9P5Q305_9AGAR|nr:hypothetical protein BDP27DRAFT_1416923 [Rhodocollybia butyracea]